MTLKRALASMATMLGLLGMLAAAPGCARGPKTPGDAYDRLAAAVAARDGAALFDALDLETRWSWMTIQRSLREAHDITLSNFPEGPERERQLRRFEAAAVAESAKELFARELDAKTWEQLAPLPQGTPRFREQGLQAEADLGDGRKLQFRKRTDGGWGWGWTGLAEVAEQRKRRALADLELIQASAADHERAATRGQR